MPPQSRILPVSTPVNSLRSFITHPEKIADVTGTTPPIAGRHINIRFDMARQFRHKRLAKTHTRTTVYLFSSASGQAAPAWDPSSFGYKTPRSSLPLHFMTKG